MRIELEVSEENEGTDAPWWAIIDPRQSLKAHFHEIATMVTGPFFSRESAEEHLKGRRYAFGKRAIVYCFSGHASREYKEACRNGREASGRILDSLKERLGQITQELFNEIPLLSASISVGKVEKRLEALLYAVYNEGLAAASKKQLLEPVPEETPRKECTHLPGCDRSKYELVHGSDAAYRRSRGLPPRNKHGYVGRCDCSECVPPKATRQEHVLDPLEDLNQLRADAEVQLRKNHNKKDGET